MEAQIEVTKAEWFDDRIYWIKKQSNDYYISSVTTRLQIEEKPFLYRYYADLGWDEARKRVKEAQDRGVRIHYAWYIYIMGGVVIYNNWRNPTYTEAQIKEISNQNNGLISVLTDQSEMVAMWKLQRFFEKVNPKIISAEQTVYSIEKDIAGTLDNAFKIQAGTYDVNGSKGLVIPTSGIYLADLKTGNQVSESAWAQLAAYSEAFKDMGLGEPLGGLILHPGASTRKGIEGFSVELKTAEELKPHYEIYKHLSAVWKARNPNFGPVVFEFPSIIKRAEVTA